MKRAILLTVIFFVVIINEEINARTNRKSNKQAKNIDEDVEIENTTAKISSKSRDIASHSRRLLRRMEKQNQVNSENLAECYEQLGKYTRLLLVHANSDLESNTTRFLNLEEQRLSGFKSYAMFIMQTELEYYLNELERNYRVINDLQTKLISLNRSITTNDNLQFGGSIDRLPSHQGFNRSIPLDCTMVVGTGYIQIDLMSPNQYNLNRPEGSILNKIAVYCEYGWLVIQQRSKGFETNFNRTWKDYSLGFGSLKGDFWLGLEIVNRLTQQRPHELLIELTDWSDQIFLAQYEEFEISPESDQYRLSLSGAYSGNASKDFLDDAYNGMSSQNGAPFSTYDKWRAKSQPQPPEDQQMSGEPTTTPTGIGRQQRNCALRSGGGWWFANQQTCLPVNLNGVYVNGASAPLTRGIKWQAVRPFDRNYSLKRAKMKIRPKITTSGGSSGNRNT